MVSPRLKWSAYAGGYGFLVSTVLLLILFPVSDALGTLLSLPGGSSAFVLAAPVPFLGTVGWWAIVERRHAYTYPVGAICGAAIGAATVLFWVLVFAIVWGPPLVVVGGVLVGFVAVVSLPAAALVGVPLTYARRRVGAGLPNEG